LPVITPENAAHVAQVAMLVSYGIIADIAWSPDGRTLALGSGNGLVFLLDAEQLDARPRILSGHSAAVTGLAFSADGMLLASAGGGDVRLWEVDSGAEQAAMEVLNATSLAFSPDGTLLALGGGRNVHLLRTRLKIKQASV
jgi:WD40 repeat protein